MARAIDQLTHFVSLAHSVVSTIHSQPTMATEPGWNSVAGIATNLLDGNLVAIAIAMLITFGVPVLLHVIFYRSAAAPPSSNFLLLGSSGAGKTAFTSLVSYSLLPFLLLLT